MSLSITFTAPSASALLDAMENYLQHHALLRRAKLTAGTGDESAFESYSVALPAAAEAIRAWRAVFSRSDCVGTEMIINDLARGVSARVCITREVAEHLRAAGFDVRHG